MSSVVRTPAGDTSTQVLRWLLALVGVCVLVLAVLLLVNPDPFSSSRVTKQITKRVAGGETIDKTVDSTSTQSPSDRLVGAIAAVGGGLLLAAALLPRLASFKAFGVEVALTEAEKEAIAGTAVKAGKVAEKLTKVGVSEEDAQKVAPQIILYALDLAKAAQDAKNELALTGTAGRPVAAVGGAAEQATLQAVEDKVARQSGEAAEKRLSL